MLLKYRNLIIRDATEKDAEQLGFTKLRINENSWRNQLNELQSSIDYELYQEDFINFAK